MPDKVKENNKIGKMGSLLRIGGWRGGVSKTKHAFFRQKRLLGVQKRQK